MKLAKVRGKPVRSDKANEPLRYKSMAAQGQKLMRRSDEKAGNVSSNVSPFNYHRPPLTRKLLKIVVARDGFEPPTPAFSGPRSTN